MRIERYKGVSLRQNDNGFWYYHYTIRAKTFKKSLKTTKIGEAKAKLDLGIIDKVNRMRLGIEKAKDRYIASLSESVELFLEDVWSKTKQSNGYKRNLERIVREFTSVIGREAMLTEIGVPQKKEYLRWLRKNKSALSKGGFNHRLKLLRVWDKWCAEYYDLGRDMLLINRKDMVENNTVLERFISPDEWKLVCKNVDQGWLIHYFRFGYYLGVRRGEIVKMQLRNDGKLWIYGKRGKVRKLPLPVCLMDDHAFIVAHREGKSVKSLCDEISRGWCRAAKKAKVYLPCGCGFDDWSKYKRGNPCPMCKQPFHPLGNGKTFHGTRHAFVTRSLEEGINQVIVSKLAGHSNLATTEKYITMSDDHIIGKLSSDKTDGMVDENTKAWYASIGQESAN